MNYAPEPVGVGRYTAELGSYLREHGFEVDVITAVPHYPGWELRDGFHNGYTRAISDGIQVLRCPLILKQDMRGVWRFLAPLSFAISSAPIAIWQILKRRPDTVLCIEPTVLVAPIALLFARLVGARLVMHVQDLEIDAAFAVGHLRGSIWRKVANSLEKALLKQFDTVVTISNKMAERLEDKGVTREQLKVVRNWVNLETIKPLLRPSVYRQELGLAPTVFVVLYAGNVGAKQGLEVMLDAAEHLLDDTDILFVVAGDGPEKARLLTQYGHLPNARFLPIQPESRLCELLNFADLHLLPQQHGASDLVFPSKLGGMLASGKPCIVMADEGTELYDFVGESVIAAPPGDDQILSEVIRRIAHTGRTWAGGRVDSLLEQLDARKSLRALQEIIFPELAAIMRSRNNSAGPL